MRIAVRGTALAALLAGACSLSAAPAPNWPAAVAHAARLAPEARIVVLDVATGKLLAANHLADAARTLAAPGSALKPLVLYGLTAAGRWDPSRRIACTRKLAIAGHALDCSHPLADPMEARQALGWSCNTYFAALAATLKPGELRGLLAPTGLLGQTGLAAGEATAEAVADWGEPHSAGKNSLAVLGVEGIRVTPLELAAAYRWLALQLAAHPSTVAALTVRGGLADSASFGMAEAAGMGGVPVAGKTGTASLAAGSQTHGWFAGLAPADAPSVVVAVYLPAGHGADAARVAAELLARSPLRKPRP